MNSKAFRQKGMHRRGAEYAEKGIQAGIVVVCIATVFSDGGFSVKYSDFYLPFLCVSAV